MDWKIPQSVFDEHKKAVDAMIDDNFGVNCRVITIERVETIVSNPTTNNMPTRNSVNSHRKRGSGGYDRGEVTVTEKETSSIIKLRCYWTNKDWVAVDNNAIVDPEAKVQTIGYLKDLPAVTSAKAVVLNTNMEEYQDRRYVLAGDPLPWGFQQDRYFVAYWKEA